MLICSLDISEVVPAERHLNMDKGDSFGFLREIIVIEEIIFGPKMNTTEHFSKSVN